MIAATLKSCYIAKTFGTRQEETCNTHRGKARNVFGIKEFEIDPDSPGEPLDELKQSRDIITFSYLKKLP